VGLHVSLQALPISIYLKKNSVTCMSNATSLNLTKSKGSSHKVKIKTGLSTWVGDRHRATGGKPDWLVPCRFLWPRVHSGMTIQPDCSYVGIWGIVYMTTFYDDGRRIEIENQNRAYGWHGFGPRPGIPHTG